MLSTDYQTKVINLSKSVATVTLRPYGGKYVVTFTETTLDPNNSVLVAHDTWLFLKLTPATKQFETVTAQFETRRAQETRERYKGPQLYQVTTIAFVIADNPEQAQRLAVENASVFDTQLPRPVSTDGSLSEFKTYLQSLGCPEWLHGSPYGSDGDASLEDIFTRGLPEGDTLPDTGQF